MNSGEDALNEERLLSYLLACDGALAAGASPPTLGGPDTPPDLRGRLDGGLACLNFLEQVWPRHGGAGTVSAAPSGAEPTFAARRTDWQSVLPNPQQGVPGTHLGRFQIRRELGRGTYGIVFLAFDPQLGREVALKIPRPDTLATPALRRRFQHEARAAAGLDHPNLVPVYEAGEVGPVCYIASAYCPGPTLARWLKQRQELLPAQAAATLVASLAEAVHHAHGRGVLHRDLKPANILLASVVRSPWSVAKEEEPPATDYGLPTTDHGLIPKITDFGLAKVLAGEAGGFAGSQTQTGEILGTPHYMAPEQAAGKNEHIGPASDIYSLGATLYELLTGRPPFQAESVVETLDQLRRQDPVLPRQLRAKLPRDLETICLKCLEKEPVKRYASAGELAEDLRRFLAGEPIRARPVRAWERVVKWARRQPAAAALVAVSSLAMVLLVVGLVVGIVLIADALREKGAALGREKEALEKSEQTSSRNAVAAAEREFSAKNWGGGEEFLHECPENLRKWEWHYLMRLRHIDPISLPDAYKPLSMAEGFDLAFHPDSRLLAIPSCGNTTQVWDASSGRKVWDLRGDQGGDSRVRSVAFSPNGRFLASGSDDRSVAVWDTTTGVAKWTHRHAGPVKGVAFSPDGRFLASVSGGANKPGEVKAGEVKVWEATTGKLLRTFPGQALQPPPIVHVAFSPNGSWLAAGSMDNTDLAVKVWDVTTGEEVYILSGHADCVDTVTFTPDGCRLVSLGRDRRVNVWDLPPRERRTDFKSVPQVWGGLRLAPRWTWTKGTNSANSLALSPPDGSLVAFGGPTADGAVRVYDLNTGELKHVLKGDYRTVSVAFSPDGSRLVSAGHDRNVRLWDTTTGHEVLSLRGHDDIVGRVLFSPDGQRLATACADGTLRIWDATPFDEKSQPHIRTIGGHEGEFYGLDFSPDSRRLASASADGLIELWDPRTGKVVRAFPGPGHEEAALCVAFSPDGRLLLSGTLDRTAKLRDAQTGEKRLSLAKDFFTVMVRQVAFRPPDGKVFATASLRELRLWDLDGRLVLTLPQASPELVNGVAFSPNGEYVATVGPAATGKVWNAANGHMVSSFAGHQGTVNCVAFHPKQNYLASGGSDKEVKLWAPDSPTGRAIHPPLSGHTDYLQSVAFSADGKYLASASWKEVILWDVTSRDNIKRVPEFDRFGGRLAGRIWCVAFSPDGKRLAAASGYKGKGEIKIWDASLWDQSVVRGQ